MQRSGQRGEMTHARVSEESVTGGENKNKGKNAAGMANNVDRRKGCPHTAIDNRRPHCSKFLIRV